MKEEYGDILDMECDAVCITTNGFVKTNGELVMGHGIAKQIQNHFPNITKELGTLVKSKGNIVHQIYPMDGSIPAILSFPVKSVSKVCQSHDDYVSHK